MLKITHFFILVVFLITSITNLFGQRVQKEALSTIGYSNTLSSGYYISFSVGQQSVIGQFDFNNIAVRQGFQFPFELAICYDDCNPKNILTILYPNPFIDTIYFKFSEKINEEITISIYDIQGRILYQNKKIPLNEELIIDNINVEKGNYIIELKSFNYRYTSKIIKK